MRLSDYKNEEAMELMADLMDYVMEIVVDPETEKMQGVDKITFVKFLLKHHPKSVIKILARIDQTPVEQYECDFFRLPAVLLETLSNPMITNLFQLQERNEGGKSSGPATETTLEEKTHADS